MTEKELRQKAMALPLQPGVYIMKNKDKKIIYIGKAKKLKNRVSSYFGSHSNHSLKVIRMVENVDDFDYILVDTEFEALVLECSLIKQHMPKYNILLKDDKGYNYIKITKGEFPRISECKRMDDDGATYVGPYISGFSVKQAVEETAVVDTAVDLGRSFHLAKRGVEPGTACGQGLAPGIVPGTVEQDFHLHDIVVHIGGVVKYLDEVVLIEISFGVAGLYYLGFEFVIEPLAGVVVVIVFHQG